MSKLIGRTVRITDEKSLYFEFVGEVLAYDGTYHIGKNHFDNIVPVFDREQFEIWEYSQYEVFVEQHCFSVIARSKRGARKIAGSQAAYKAVVKMYRKQGLTPKIVVNRVIENKNTGGICNVNIPR